MRDILFRGKRIDNGEWVEGYLVETRHNTYHDGYRIIDKDGINYDELDYYEPSFMSYVIDKDTICQYTGLTDKNGHKIWENDILKYEWDGKVKIDVIKYEAPMFTYSKSMRWSLYKDEVIGNIFDNPELLNE